MLMIAQIKEVATQYQDGLITWDECRNKLVMIMIDAKIDEKSINIISRVLTQHL